MIVGLSWCLSSVLLRAGLDLPSFRHAIAKVAFSSSAKRPLFAWRLTTSCNLVSVDLHFSQTALAFRGRKRHYLGNLGNQTRTQQGVDVTKDMIRLAACVPLTRKIILDDLDLVERVIVATRTNAGELRS